MKHLKYWGLRLVNSALSVILLVGVACVLLISGLILGTLENKIPIPLISVIVGIISLVVLIAAIVCAVKALLLVFSLDGFFWKLAEVGDVFYLRNLNKAAILATSKVVRKKALIWHRDPIFKDYSLYKK